MISAERSLQDFPDAQHLHRRKAVRSHLLIFIGLAAGGGLIDLSMQTLLLPSRTRKS